MVCYFIILTTKVQIHLNNHWKGTWKNEIISCECVFPLNVSSWVISKFFYYNNTF